ncbi:MAG: preprotein translocase subunit YidC [bacterium P3]|nr:MAG: preprotein translocase subunit YidC [bacterium P201]KWW30454.1 MAG: preprotein translocase subunit YidC [bacterium P3]KWW41341.1 MAG: preprotein translocase subunit YidC [bacterium F083]
MNKKSVIGFILIFAIFIGYMWWVSPSAEERAEMQRRYDSIAEARMTELEQARMDSLSRADDDSLTGPSRQNAPDLGAFSASGSGVNMMTTVDNGVLSLVIDNHGAMVKQVTVQHYTTYEGMPLVLITPSENNMSLLFATEDNRTVRTKDLVFVPYVNGVRQTAADSCRMTVGEDDSLRLQFRAYAGDSTGRDTDSYIEFAYTVRDKSYLVDFDITLHNLDGVVRNTNFLDFEWHNRMVRQEKVDRSGKGSRNRNKDPERFYSNIFYKPVKDDVDHLRDGRDSEQRVKTAVDWVAFKQQFFCAILTNDEGFVNADLSTKTNDKDTLHNYMCDMHSTVGIEYDGSGNGTTRMAFYYGPTKFHDLKSMDRGFEKMLPLGMWVFSKFVSRYVIIPVFNFLETFNWNYGIIVLVLTFLMRLVLFPLTFRSYQSSAITRILKPEMDAINKKYPKQEQLMQKQQEMSRLQKRAGINPLAGCLPMLIQLPILTAMFWFYPASIELRQKSFLWCHDLSTYDSVLDLGFNIPLYGDHVSLFCLLMFAVQFFYTWYTMRSQAGQMNMPGMKFMMYFMPFMMLFLFNSQSAALNLYYFTSLSITMVQMILIRRFTSEQKVRARMAAYDQKHKNGTQKKSKFQQRLEEMQRMSEQMQKQNAKRR